jgi:hypothetical protein
MRLTLVMLSTLLALPALAYRETIDFQQGFYWSRFPVSMIVADANATRLQQIKGLVDQATAEWESGLENLWNITGQSSGSGNVIRWSNNFGNETGLDESSVLAVTIRYSQGPYIVKGEIIINGNNRLNSAESNLRTVIVHEMGHTLGLDHSEYNNAVMAANLIFNYQGLHWDDQQGMAHIVSTTKQRQAIGYVSPLSSGQEEESSSALGSCGTVDMGGGSGGGGSMILSLGLGMLMTLALFKRRSV